MSKKMRKPKIKIKKNKNISNINHDKMVNIARQISAEMIYPFELEFKKLRMDIFEIKNNLMAFMTALERKEMITDSEFQKVYSEIIEDRSSEISGRPIISIYNKEKQNDCCRNNS
jgi:hypothetical protein